MGGGQREVEAVTRSFLLLSGGRCVDQNCQGFRFFGALYGEHVGELGRNPIAEDCQTDFSGDVDRSHVQLPKALKHGNLIE